MDTNLDAGAGAPAGDDSFINDLLADSARLADERQAPTPEPAPQPAPVAREPERIPLPEYLQEREKRQALERRVQEFEAAERKRQEDTGRAQLPDFYADPHAYFQNQEKQFNTALEQRFQQLQTDRLKERVDDDVERVLDQHPDEWPDAERWFTEQLKTNPTLGPLAAQQRRPAQWVLKQFRESKTISEVGSDLSAYQEKLLADPAFLARVTEAARAHATGNPRFEPPRAADGKFQQQKALPSMRTAGAAAPTGGRVSEESGDDLLDDIMAGT